MVILLQPLHITFIITCSHHPASPPDSKSLSKTSTELTILVYLRPHCWCLGNICYFYYRCFSCCCCCHYYYDYHCYYYCQCRHPTRDYLFSHFCNGFCICSLIALHSLGIISAVIHTWSTIYSNVTYVPNSSKLNFLPPETSILRECCMIKNALILLIWEHPRLPTQKVRKRRASPSIEIIVKNSGFCVWHVVESGSYIQILLIPVGQ